MTTKLATKGQIVLPKAVRDQLGLEAGDDLEVWIDEGSEIILRPLRHEPNEGLVDHLRSAPGPLEIPERSRDVAQPLEL